MAEIQVIEREVRGAEFRQIMHEFVDIICDNYAEAGMAGFEMTGFGFDGSFSSGFRLHNESPFGVTLLPAVVPEILRRHTAADVAKDVVHEML